MEKELVLWEGEPSLRHAALGPGGCVSQAVTRCFGRTVRLEGRPAAPVRRVYWGPR